MRNGQWMIAVIGSLLVVTNPVDARTWTNSLGRTFEAEFVRLDGANVIFALPNGGRSFSTPLAELSTADQIVLRGGGDQARWKR